MVCSRIEGPDFICIGMPKAGTGWLFDQLQYHPDFWMPPIKELHYLDRRYPKLKVAARQLRRSSERVAKLDHGRGSRPWLERDFQFIRELASSGNGQPMDIERYVRLFRYKGEMLSGDISPGYSRLREDVILQVAAQLPRTKILLLVRDPIARVWSSLSMSHRHGKFDRTLLDDSEQFRLFLRTSKLVQQRSYATTIIARWARLAPTVQFHAFQFDLLEQKPEKARREILAYLGADPEKGSGQLPPDHNRKANSEKLPMSNSIRAVMIEEFGEEVLACARVLGGAAREWGERYGL
jgi:hypothetical protein